MKQTIADCRMWVKSACGDYSWKFQCRRARLMFACVTLSLTMVPAGSILPAATVRGASHAEGRGGLVTPSSQGAHTSAPMPAGVIPASYFGLTVLNFEKLTPDISYGLTRTWDSYPNLDWADVNPAPGVYNFSDIDKFLRMNAGRQIIYTLGRTPRWASSDPDIYHNYGPGQCAAPARLEYLDQYLTALAQHVRGRIRYWELGNEVNDPRFYCSGVEAMVLMAKHTRAVLAAVDPQAQILSPSVTGDSGPAWLGRFLAAGGGSYVDAIAFHGYWDTSGGSILPLIARYRKVLDTYGAAEKPLWDTEGSWADFGIHPLQGSAPRAAFLAEYYLLQWSAGVKAFVWFAYDGGETWGGLWDARSGEHEDAQAYAQIYRWMVGATMTKPCRRAASGVWTCSFERPSHEQSCVVWSESAPVRFAPGAGTTAIFDLQGQRKPFHAGAMIVVAGPVLIEGGTC